MAWELKDEDLLKRIAAVTAPPTDLQGLLSDELWVNAFSMWATDLGFQRGDYKASRLYHLWVDLNYSASGETILARYVDPSGELAIEWPTSVVDRFERVANGMDSEYSGALAETRAAATEMLESYGSQFRDDVQVLQSAHVSEPTRPAINLTKPDMGAVDRINQMVLKDLPEYKSSKGTADALRASQVKFYAAGSVVLIGDNHPATYYGYLDALGHTVGTITMMRRGGAFSPGRVEVAVNDLINPGGKPLGDLVMPDQGDIRQAVTEAIGRVSNKEVQHRS